MVDLIIPEVVERMYRDLARFKQSQPPRASAPLKQIALTRADVDAIIGRTRGASPEELEYVISHAKEFSLTDGHRDQMCCDFARGAVAAQR